MVLKTPVEEGNIWYNLTYTKYSISQVKATKDVPAGVYNDTVIIRVTDPDWNLTLYREIYISPTVGLLAWVVVYDEAATGWIEDGLELQDVDEP